MHLLPHCSAKSLPSYAKPMALACLAVFLCAAADSPSCSAQVRTKKPDRGVYQPPLVAPLASRSTISERYSAGLQAVSRPPRLAELMRGQQPSAEAQDSDPEPVPQESLVKPNRPLVEVELTEVTEDPMSRAEVSPSIVPNRSKLKRVSHQ